MSMVVGESSREYVARPKELARAVKHHGIDKLAAKEKIYRRILGGFPSSMRFVHEVFAFNHDFFLVELE